VKEIRWHLTFKLDKFQTKLSLFPTVLERWPNNCPSFVCIHPDFCLQRSSQRMLLKWSFTRWNLYVPSLTQNLFRSLWQRFDFPFGSYSLDISFRQTSTESSTSAWDIIDKSLNWSGISFSALDIDFLPIPKKDVQLVRYCTQLNLVTCTTPVQEYNAENS
jgi:hypothetical protein